MSENQSTRSELDDLLESPFGIQLDKEQSPAEQ